MQMTETEITFLVHQSPEGGYEARAIGHSIFTEAETVTELHEMIEDALKCHFDADIPFRIVYPRQSP